MPDFLTDRDCVTWADRRPSHPNKTPILDDAKQIMINAWDEHMYACELVEMTLDDDARRDFIAAEQVLLAEAMKLNAAYAEMRNEAQAVAEAHGADIDG
jgi:hypothetical protein